MEVVAARALLRPTTIALCPPRHLLAAATAARGGNNSDGGAATAAGGGINSGGGAATAAGGGGGSCIDVLRLWREDGEKDVGRHLKRVACIGIRDCDGPLHRLAWSRAEASSEYRVGLLAGGLEGGAVRIWDPSRLLYEPDLDNSNAKVSCGRRVSWSEEDGSSSSASLGFLMYDFDGVPKPQTVVDQKAPVVKFKDIIEPIAARMRNEVDSIIKDHVAKKKSSKVDLQHDTNCDSNEWEFIPSEEIVTKLADPSTDHMWNALVLKLDKLSGPVMGLAFNNQYPNMLASAAYGETVNIHYVDYPTELATRGQKKLQTQMIFLEWHPFLPAILASTCDIGDTKIWDLRENSCKVRYQQNDKRKCICSEVHWNPSNPGMLAAASKDSFPMKIWDTRHSQEVLFEFGTGKGVASFSWSPCGQIITTDVDGASDCWKLDDKWEPSCWSISASGVSEAQWCPSKSTMASVSADRLNLYKMPAEDFCWPSWEQMRTKDLQGKQS